MPRVKGYVPEVEDVLPPSRPAALIRVPATAFASKDALRCFLNNLPSAQGSTKTLGQTLNAALFTAAGSDGAPLKPKKRSRAETVLEAQVEEANVPQYKPLRPIRSRAGRPVKTYPKFHFN